MYAGALRIKLNVHRIRNHTQASVLVCASTWAALGERQALDRFLQRQLVLRNHHHTQGGREHGLWDEQKSICSLTSKFLAHALIYQQPGHNLGYSGIQRETELACLWLVTF